MASRLGPACPRVGAGGSVMLFVVQAGKLHAHVLDNLPAPRLAFERGSYDLAELARIRMPSRLTAADAGTAIVSSSSAVATKRPGSPGKSSANRWPREAQQMIWPFHPARRCEPPRRFGQGSSAR
jgi:hypothetical protein